MIFPATPEKPGFGTIPSKSTVPCEFENVGSVAHIESIDPTFETCTTCSVSCGNTICPPTAFNASCADTYTDMVNVWLKLYVRVVGEKYNVAACADPNADAKSAIYAMPI